MSSGGTVLQTARTRIVYARALSRPPSTFHVHIFITPIPHAYHTHPALSANAAQPLAHYLEVLVLLHVSQSSESKRAGDVAGKSNTAKLAMPRKKLAQITARLA